MSKMIDKQQYPTPDAYHAACRALWKHRNTISEAIAIWESMDDFDDAGDVMEKVIDELRGGLQTDVANTIDYQQRYEVLIQAIRDGLGEFPPAKSADDLIDWIESTCPFVGDLRECPEEETDGYSEHSS